MELISRPYQAFDDECDPRGARLPGNLPGPNRRSPSLLRGLAVAIFSVAAVIAVRRLLSPVLGGGSAFLLLTPAVMLSAWYGGLWPGLLATGLSAAVMFPVLAADGMQFEEWDRLALFIAVGVAVTWLHVRAAAATSRIRTLL